MVKLQRGKSGTFFLSVPKIKADKLKLGVGDEFDVTDADGNLVYVRIKKS